METNEKKSLFTAVSEEESATVSGGSLLESIFKLIGTEPARLTTSPNAVVSSTGILSASVNGVQLTVDLTGGSRVNP